MKNTLTILGVALIVFTVASSAYAQMMGNPRNGRSVDWNEVARHTREDEEKGGALWDKLQSGDIECANLSDDDFDALGEYFMRAMMGDSHAAMNAMMIQAHGEEGEEQIHIAMGKRISACDPSAVISQEGFGWMPMMQMMFPLRQGFGGQGGGMYFGSGFGFFGWVFMILWWALIIAVLVALVKWLTGRQGGGTNKSALDILKERYARGEIDNKEFEDRKKDLTV